MEDIFLILEMIGVVAFAVSGAAAAIDKNTDIFGVMFLGLTKATKLGDKIPATLVFKSGAKLKVEFQVAAAAPGTASGKAPAADAHHHH